MTDIPPPPSGIIAMLVLLLGVLAIVAYELAAYRHTAPSRRAVLCCPAAGLHLATTWLAVEPPVSPTTSPGASFHG